MKTKIIELKLIRSEGSQELIWMPSQLEDEIEVNVLVRR